MKIYQANEIRNIALIGSAKSGKTTLAECMLLEGGVITRRGTVEEKNTVSDYRDVELDRGNSVTSTVLYGEYNGKKINFIDTPGFPDFIGEVIAALNVVDAAVMVVNAQNGIEVGTEINWRYTVKYNTPLFFVINQLEHEKANFDETVRQLKEVYGEKVTIAQYPVNAGVGFNSLIDLVMMKMLKFPVGGGKPEVLDIPANEKEKSEELQKSLIESAAAGDDSLMEIFFEKETLTPEEIQKGIKSGIRKRDILPVFCVSAKQNMGVARLMEFIGNAAPEPTDSVRKTKEGKELKSSISDPLSLLVFKTSMEPHLGEVSFFRVFAGEVAESIDVTNARTRNKERMTQLFVSAGKNRQKVEKLVAGDIGSTIKLKETRTNDTLNSVKNPNDIIEPIIFPDPIYRTAVKAVNSSDDEKLGTILNEMHKTDPTLLVGFSKELRQLLVEGQGEFHINTVKWFFDNVYKIGIEFIAPRIPYRETITKPAKSMYRHKKQSGGAGQFGEVWLLIQPYFEGMANPTEFPVRGKEEHILPWGGKLVYHNCVVGGAIDARFQPAILKGIMEKMEQGPLTGSYARDIAVYIYDGKMHPVDSNEISFKLAGRNAFSQAFKEAGPKILEPIYDVEVLVPDERMGDVITDLQGRRGVMMGMDSDGNMKKILARVPLAEMNRYSTALSSITSGRATYSMKFAEYAQVPSDVQGKLLKEYEAHQEEE